MKGLFGLRERETEVSETMSRDEQIRWCALRIAHANKPSFATHVVHEPPNVLKRATCTRHICVV
jgi:hypothetical protein